MRLLPHLFLFLFAAMVFWPGIQSTDAVDRAEPRYLQTSKQMIQSGEYGHTMIRNFPRNEEPVGLHWAQIAGVKLTGADPDAVWGYRVAGWLAMSLLVALVFSFANSLLAGLAERSRLASLEPSGNSLDRMLGKVLPRDAAGLAAMLTAVLFMIPWYVQANARLANPEAALTSDQKEVANHFVNYFTELGEKLTKKINTE